MCLIGGRKMEKKKALVIGGTGAIGTYTCDELVSLGWELDVITLEECQNTEAVTYHTMKSEYAALKVFLGGRHYEAIVDFMHYMPENYPPILELLTTHTEQLVFLSSYRIYADIQHPITENAPQLVDFYSTEVMLEQSQSYAWAKSGCEKIIAESPYAKKVTVVRPVIAFCHKRLSFISLKAPNIMCRAGKKPLLAPKEAKDVIAGFSFSGNVGKEIAHLIGKKDAMGEAFTLGGTDRLTWGEIAKAFEESLGCEFVWVDADTYLENTSPGKIGAYYGLHNDRLLNRDVDISKVLRVTGLTESDLVPTLEAVKAEAEIVKKDIEYYTKGYSEEIEINQDNYFKSLGM